MIFISTNSDKFPYVDAEKLYVDNKKYFLPLDISFNQLIQGLHGNLWACFEDNKFIGCIYFELKENKWYLSGFSKRKMYKYIPYAINGLCELYFKDQAITEIYSDTAHRHAQYALKRAGFIQIGFNLYLKKDK